MCCHGSHMVKRRMLGSLALCVLESSMAVHRYEQTAVGTGAGGWGWESDPEQSLGESRC